MNAITVMTVAGTANVLLLLAAAHALWRGEFRRALVAATCLIVGLAVLAVAAVSAGASSMEWVPAMWGR